MRAHGVLLLLLAAQLDRGSTSKQDLLYEFPYLASLQLRGLHACAAAVLGAEWLLTTAHCVEGQLHEWVSAHVLGGNVHQAARIFIHPRYSPLNMDYNIALVKVAPMNVEGVSLAGAAAEAAAWSGEHIKLLSLQGETFHVLPVMEVRGGECNEQYRKFGGVTPRMLCIEPARSGDSLCKDEGGGPLMVNSSLLGLTSHGQGCTHAPTVATRVPAFAPWIFALTSLSI